MNETVQERVTGSYAAVNGLKLEIFALRGGQTDGLMGGMPRSQLAILPATTHGTV